MVLCAVTHPSLNGRQDVLAIPKHGTCSARVRNTLSLLLLLLLLVMMMMMLAESLLFQ